VPKIRRQNIPPALFQHLLDRMQSRKIRSSQLERLATWLDTEPDVPEGQWYKRFSGMTVCGEGDLVKTFLIPGQHPNGERVS
jgi:ribosomal protein S18 acetylase RimI-like enzyme